MTRYHLLILLGVSLFLSSCSYTQKVKTGDVAYEVKQYAVAVDLLQKEYNRAKTRREKGEIAWYLAESYKELNQRDKAIDWYLRAYDNQYGVDALKEYAFALKAAERYEEAIQAFKDLGLEIGSPYEYRREIQACEIAAGWKNIEESDYTVEVMDFNSGFSDYSPVVYGDNQLVFTSDRKLSVGEETYNWTGNDFSDLFVIDLDTRTVNSFDNAINTEDNEGTVTFNPSYTEMYFTRCFGPKKEDSYCKIMYSRKEGEHWTAPQVLPFIQANINYGHPALSSDGRRLYFAAKDLEGMGIGGYDLFVSVRSGDEWGEPVPLNRTINTIGNEKFPFVDADTLYFASDFHTGMGGLDIFRSYILPNGNWSVPYNLKPPINSGGDDFGLVIDRFAKLDPGIMQSGYFTSTRETGIGNDDIYRFERRIPPPEPVKDTLPEVEEVAYKIILNGYVLEKIFEEPNDPNSKVLGRKPLDGAKVIAKLTAGKELQNFTVGEDGLFTMELEVNQDYTFIASMEGYLNNAATFSTKGLGLDPEIPVQTYEIEIVLDKIFLNKEIVLENIYYDFDKWDIREDAQPTLNELAENLRLNPDIRIQLASHTDCRGSTRYNEDLSQKRAQSAVDYLIGRGIDPLRLVAKGFGESQPAVDCLCARCTEEEHQENRRTTFAIIE